MYVIEKVIVLAKTFCESIFANFQGIQKTTHFWISGAFLLKLALLFYWVCVA